MANSIVTKKALAAALKKLMEEQPFEKITVTQICARCGVSRKTFYHHFRDKYDLVNRIFDMECTQFTAQWDSADDMNQNLQFIENICQYFYDNRSFYIKALQIKGQNSFSDHLHESLRPLIREKLLCFYRAENVDDFTVDFLTDACCFCIKRWLSERECLQPAEFVSRLQRIVAQSTFLVSPHIL